MRVLFISPMPPDPQGGGAIPVLLYTEIAALQRQHQVTLVTVAGPDPAELAALDRVADLGVEIHAVRRSEPAGMDRWRRRWRFGTQWAFGNVPWRTVWFHEPGVQEILDNLLSQRRFDLVHVEDNAAASYRFSTDIPVLLTEHEVRRSRPFNWSQFRLHDGYKGLLAEIDWHRWQHFHSQVWNRADAIQVFTERDAELVREMAPVTGSRVRVNPFPVSIPEDFSNLPGEEGTVLFVGNFTHQPNVDAALWLGNEIMPLLRQRVPHARLTLVGGHVPDEVRALGSDWITITGFVPELETFICRAAIVLAPIRIGGGMRMKVLQAMAYGKAVVTTSRGAAGLEVSGARPPLEMAEDAEEFADLAAILLRSPQARLTLARQARAFVSEFHSPEAYVSRLDVIYQELVFGNVQRATGPPSAARVGQTA